MMMVLVLTVIARRAGVKAELGNVRRSTGLGIECLMSHPGSAINQLCGLRQINHLLSLDHGSSIYKMTRLDSITGCQLQGGRVVMHKK